MNNSFSRVGYPPRKNNLILPLVDGEKAWKQMEIQMKNAKKSIHLCFWMLSSELEILRYPKDTFKDPTARQAYTLGTLLFAKQRTGVKVRILLYEWPATAVSGPFVKDTLVRLGGSSGLLEVMYEPHPKTIGSWHQKSIIIDDEVAFVGGMNAKENDWDTTKHEVFDYRRSPHKSSGKSRRAWKKRGDATKFPPRHDLMAMIMGPLVEDVATNFNQRWNGARAAKVNYHEHTTALSAPPKQKGVTDILGQITRTMPSKYPPVPTGEQGILDLYRKAIRNAEKYIYIEDQYFRSQIMAKEIAKAIKKNRKLHVVVVTQPDYASDLEPNEWWKVGTLSSKWSSKAFQIIKKVRPNFTLYYLQVGHTTKKGIYKYLPINLHAKIMVVDDEWYTIGSCNLNDRGFLWEGELNVAAQHKSAKSLRKELFAEHLDSTCPDPIDDAFKLWYQHAGENAKAWKTKKAPTSRVFPFRQAGPLASLPNVF
jgi:phosphatidylserine/phosphatidylglycerophosphate/cardiolipin synthase-like enzyme